MEINRNCYVKSCLSVFFFCLVILVFSEIFSNNDPTFSIDYIYVPALNKTTNTVSVNSSSLIEFDLKIHNENDFVALYYDDIRIMFSYFPNHEKVSGSSIPIGSYQVPSFYQGNGRTKHVKDVVETHGYSPFVSSETTKSNTVKVAQSVNVMRKLMNNVFLNYKPDVVVFRVDLVAHLRFKDILNPNKFRLVVGADVEVDDQTGKKVNNKGITLI